MAARGSGSLGAKDKSTTATQDNTLPRPAAAPLLPHSYTYRRWSETSFPFAGRLGGNQGFTIDLNNPGAGALLKEVPDAAPFFSWKSSFSLEQFKQLGLWKAAFIEGWATLMITYITILIAVSLAPAVSILSTGPLVPTLIGSITNAIVLPLFIFSAGPISGGHINPTISIATFFAQLSTFPRTLLYVIFQTGGAGIAGVLLRKSLGSRDWQASGCFMDMAQVSVSDAFTIEFTTDMALIFLSFGVGLDPRQREVFGPALSPVFVGLILGLCTFATGFLRPGYTGFSANPARCFGAMAGSRFQTYHWIHWLGPIAAGALHGIIYKLVPPYSRSKTRND